MFKHEYQGGSCVEVFSAQGKDGKHSIWKLSSSGIKKIFDKEVKSFIFTLDGSTSATKIQLPKEVKQSLGLTQGILVLQINVPLGVDLAVELGIMDSADQKCRLAFSTAFRETQVTALHVKVPLALIRRNVWLNLCIDLSSLVRENLKVTSYKSLESICVSGSCKLRRIFTMKNLPLDTTDDDKLYDIPGVEPGGKQESIPKQCQLVSDVHQLIQVISATKLQYYEGKGRSEFLSTARNIQLHETDMLSSTGAADNSVEYCIAFGSKVVVPNRRLPLKEGNVTNRNPSVRQNFDAESAASGGITRNDLAGKERRTGGLTTNRKQASEPYVTETGLTKDKLSNAASNWKEGSVVKPHPPRKPSEIAARRRPRVKSTSNDSNPVVNISDDAMSSDLSEFQKANVAVSKSNIRRSSSETDKLRLNFVDEATNSDSDSSDSEAYNELIKNLNKNELKNGDKENLKKGNKVYVFSSRPTCIENGRIRVDRPRKQGLASAPARKGHDFDTKINVRRRPASENTPRSLAVVSPELNYAEPEFEFGSASVKNTIEQSQIESFRNRLVAEPHNDLRNSLKSQTRQSINRKSLREITAEELQRSGGQKPYSFSKYQAGDITESFDEQQMLRSLQREAASDAAESEDEPASTQLQIGYDTMTDSSDDMSTFKSPKQFKNRSHDYQQEISNLGENFMTQSNPRDWAEIFSPPIFVPHSSTSKKSVTGKELLESSEKVHSKKSGESKGNQKREEADTDEELDLLYDPELHYFYDPHTTKYYELITPCSNSKVNPLFRR